MNLLVADGGKWKSLGVVYGSIIIYNGDNLILYPKTTFVFDSNRTSNEAEYLTVIQGLEIALELGIRELRIISDSLLIVNQVKGLYRVRAPHLQPYVTQIREMLYTLDSYELDKVHRDIIVEHLGH